MPIRLLRPEETHALRLAVLRPGQAVEAVDWPMDRADGTFHVGVEEHGRLLAVATFQPEGHPRLGAQAPFRLRGMATDPGHRGQGHGTRLLAFGVGHARAAGSDLIWCHARMAAVPFYARNGFLCAGEPFPITGIGLHHLMYLRPA